MPFPQQWPLNDHRALARFVTDDIYLPLGSDLPSPDTDSDRRRIVEAIYNALKQLGIRYSLERYTPTQGYQDIQIIRCPAEMLGEKVGTCLDLATLFCGLCLRNELSPIIVVLEGHALVAVSTKHSLREWHAYGNHEGKLFQLGPLTDPQVFKNLVDDGGYLLVECSGFAHMQNARQADAAHPESLGRDSDGTMPFDRAVAAGREQLDNAKRSFRFALDIAIARFKEGFTAYEHGTKQVPLVLQAGDSGSDGASRFLYRSRSIGFVGRLAERNFLRAFLEADRRFCWLAITGAGGTGKSRLALELCLETKPGWRAGFLPLGVASEPFREWIPNQPNLIVIDYVASRSEEVGEMVRLLAGRETELLFPVRIVILERDREAPWVAEFVGASNNRVVTERCAYPVSPLKSSDSRESYNQSAKLDSLELTTIDEPALWSIVSEAFLKSGKQIGQTLQEKTRLLAHLKEIDPEGRPLFAALFGDAIAARPGAVFWNRQALIRSVLDREEDHYWKKADVMEPDKDLLALATMSKGIVIAEEDELPSEVLARVRTLCDAPNGQDRYRALSGCPIGDRLTPLEPDMLGEIFVLKHYERRHGLDKRARVDRGLAWTLNPAGMSEFLGHAAQDFPDHPTLPILAEWHEAPWPHHFYWIRAAYYVLPALRATERWEANGESERWNAALRRCYTGAASYLVENPDGLERLLADLPDWVSTTLASVGDGNGAVAVYDQTLDLLAAAQDTLSPDTAGKLLFGKAWTLRELKLSEQEMAVYDEVVRRFADAPEPALREQVAQALFYKGVTLGQLGRSEDEIAVYDDLLRRFADAPEPVLREQVAKALVYKGVTLGQLDRSEDLIAVYDDLLRRFADAPEPALREQVAKALFKKAVRLGQLDRSEDAIAVCDDLLRRFADAPEPALREQVAKALFYKGVTIGQLDRSEDEIAVYDDLLRRFIAAPEPALREQVAKALAGKFVALLGEGCSEEASAVLSELFTRFADAPEPAIRELLKKLLDLSGDDDSFSPGQE